VRCFVVWPVSLFTEVSVQIPTWSDIGPTTCVTWVQTREMRDGKRNAKLEENE
jgi:hypothetical protein